MSSSEVVLAAFITSAFALITAIVGVIATFRKSKSEASLNDANATERITTAAGNVIDQYRKQFEVYVAEQEKYRKQLTEANNLIIDLQVELQVTRDDVTALRSELVEARAELVKTRELIIQRDLRIQEQEDTIKKQAERILTLESQVAALEASGKAQ